MDMVSSLAPLILGKVRLRGEQYFRRGSVLILHHGRDFVSASVAGSRRYAVELKHTADSLLASCSCPIYERDLEVCKHIWAAVLAAQAQGLLVGANARLPRRIEPMDFDPWGDVWDLDADEGGEGDDPDWNARARDDDLALAAVDGGEWPRRRSDPLRDAASTPVPWRQPSRPTGSRPAPAPPTWRDHVAHLDLPQAASANPIQDLHYVIDMAATARSQVIVIDLLERSRKANGDWGKPRPLKLDREQIASRVAGTGDRQLLALLAGAQQHWEGPPGWQPWNLSQRLPARVEVPDILTPLLVPLLGGSGCASVRLRREDPLGPPIAWDEGEPWQLWLVVGRRPEGGGYAVTGSLRRGEERMGLDQPLLVMRSGFLLAAERFARLDHGGAYGWIPLLQRLGRLEVPAAEIEHLMARLFALPTLARIELPEELRCEEIVEAPGRRLLLLAADGGSAQWQRASPSFRYSAGEAAAGSPGRCLYHPASRRLILRDPGAEALALARLRELGFETAPGHLDDRLLRIQRREIGGPLQTLLAEGWSVEAEGRRLRAPGRSQLAVSSGIDWFELQGGVEFDGEMVPFPELLAALRRGEDTVRLGDGSSGLLPEEWLRRIAPLAAFGRPEGDCLRFHAAQVGLLDALLAAEPAATCDAAFVRARDRLASFAGVEPAAAPRGFEGKLRGYQEAGLGWLHFLRDFGFGGCLADDMGLGKTVQVLALLEARRVQRRARGLPPSLVVVPRSLIFNWIAEAARFTPQLRVVNHTGSKRECGDDAFAGCDLVLTTYGTLRRDAAALREKEFDYVVLDEAQAIKNPASESAKAARLLKGRHRLVLTGTPVENHLGDLWSLLEFLNPGITGASAVLRAAGGALRDPDATTRAQLARGLRPFILRRTKEQVAADLPLKVEQTIFCELPDQQRRLYEELRKHYRAALGARVEERGLMRVKILVLEALLRLRQAACHPGLLERGREHESSAKLDFLLPQLAEVLDEGHKALVFSQFTSFLAILRRRLEEQQIAYAYLDGRTRDRAERVQRFQADPSCQLFLISLKAGGLGLNLTAADYVYLLDPWWNPAVEAQAIDRAHRIGQLRQVFAYRIIAKDTVEEKILQLQHSKRELADAIVGADESLLRRLSREDLDLLLS